ncbi:MAG: glycosyltransferase family 39 protein [Candidatus Aureabacteria bacterium]|nr:glycosyltransferase family 39 protein [Candidatus Auribacterota bacterium]
MRTLNSPFLLLIIAAAMITGLHYDCLFGPDEPREAEIARETLTEGHWVTPHLCGLPFLEKPPLYYNIVASAYALTGLITPTVARSVSMLFGCLMLAATFTLVRRGRGVNAAWLATFILLTMPRFWRYSHVVLLDIAVGALCTCALACIARALLWERGAARGRTFYSLFALFSAAAFLTKGFVAVFTIGAIIVPFCIMERRGDVLKKLISPLPILLFLLPVAGWLYLFYREGGTPYLYEHFVNNILGRFLQVHFELPNARFYHTDLGHRLPWYFYLTVLPEILGPWIIALPFAVWHATREIRGNGERRGKEFSVFLLLWAFLPMFLLSFSGIKERTYILPSYSALAIIIAYWIDSSPLFRRGDSRRGFGWLWIVIPFAMFALIFGQMAPRTFLFIAIALAILPASAFIHLLFKRDFTVALCLALAIYLCGLIVSSTPTMLYARFKKKCFMALAQETWRIAGTDPLYLYRPSDNIRGCVNFYGNRTVRELDLPEQVHEVLRGPAMTFVIMEEGNFIPLALDPSFENLLHIIPAETFEDDPDNMLICNRGD